MRKERKRDRDEVRKHGCKKGWMKIRRKVEQRMR